MTALKKWIMFTLGLAVLASGAVIGFVYFGVYNVSALTPHTSYVYKTLSYVRNRSVAVRSPEEIRELNQLDWRHSGVRLYETHCLQCHGAPGVAPASFSLGMMPPPSAIVRIARQRSAGELYWVIRNGIKMSGMPAWSYRLSELEMWQLVALLKKMPTFSADDYAALRAMTEPAENNLAPLPSVRPPKPDGHPGRVALQQYNCSSCHLIAGMPSATHYVGPPLTGVTQRSFIAGLLPMTRENLIHWIRNPAAIKPKTTMPNLGVSREHAEQMVDYLEALHDSPYPASQPLP